MPLHFTVYVRHYSYSGSWTASYEVFASTRNDAERQVNGLLARQYKAGATFIDWRIFDVRQN